MLCKNCNNNLTGSEDYCPYCGTPQKFPDLKVTPSENKDTDKTSPAPSESSIFHSEPVYIYADPPQEKKGPKTKLAVVSNQKQRWRCMDLELSIQLCRR